MMNRRKLFSFLAAAPVGAVIASSAPADAAPPVQRNPIAVTFEQGGYWHEWKARNKLGRSNSPPAIHAAIYDNGDIWDCTVGWRKADDDWRELLRRYMVKAHAPIQWH